MKFSIKDFFSGQIGCALVNYNSFKVNARWGMVVTKLWNELSVIYLRTRFETYSYEDMSIFMDRMVEELISEANKNSSVRRRLMLTPHNLELFEKFIRFEFESFIKARFCGAGYFWKNPYKNKYI